MIRWCAYCQEFQGEVPPFTDFSITHGICPVCSAKGAVRLEAEMDRSHLLQQAQSELMAVGRLGDVAQAERIIDKVSALGVRYVDILVGLVAPLLSSIGRGWEQGTISVAQEHRFTAFCEQIFLIVNGKMGRPELSQPDAKRPRVLLLNAYGNAHTLPVRILALWLRSKDFDTTVILEPPAPDGLAEIVGTMEPDAVLISASLAEQRAAILQMMPRFTLSGGTQPPVLIGGYAVKMQLMAPIPGAKFVTNLVDLSAMLLSGGWRLDPDAL